MFGIDPHDYFQRPREDRKVLVGYFIGRRALDAMYAHDTRPKPKKPKGGKKR